MLPQDMASAKQPPDSRRDVGYMRRAIELAQLGEGDVEPNPMVGCVLVRDGEIIGEGFHQRFGGAHAEIEAIRSVARGDASGATAYVSLEPCCHHGKTPPCSEALIRAGITRVVVALTDPFSKVAGGGLKQLRDAGVEVTSGVLEDEAAVTCAPYLKLLRTGKPWVIAKWAMTMDGRIATTAGESQWITGEAARADVHHLRSRVDGIAVGMGTVITDDPMLNARSSDPSASPARIATRLVFCRHRLPPENSRLVTTASQIPLTLVIGCDLLSRGEARQQLDRLRILGANVIETNTDDEVQMVQAALLQMGALRMTNVMVEGGGELIASFFSAGQIDECHVYIGPLAFGGRDAPGPIGGAGIARLPDSPRFQIMSLEQIQDDVKVVYRCSESP